MMLYAPCTLLAAWITTSTSYTTQLITQQASITTLEWWSTNMKFYTTLKMYRNHAGVFIILCQNSKDHLAEISQ